jgi:phosphatidylglycerol---prolipoprotein diacylglyceryl transferase
MLIHTVFDLLAAACSLAMTVFMYRWRLAGAAVPIERAGLGYVVALTTGAVSGGYGLGTLNLWLTGEPGIARSILGALAGAILFIEIYKRSSGIKGSTGIIFAPAFATTAVVGRWGCFLSGIADKTYGTPSNLPWAHDFGDGVLRHPVQLYESFAMLAFLATTLFLLAIRIRWFLRNAFYALVIFYAAQRFLWEFLKPYGAVIGPLNLFHLVCAALVVYALAMMRMARSEHSGP